MFQHRFEYAVVLVKPLPCECSAPTRAIRDGPHKGGQHLDIGGGVGVTAQATFHLPAETTHDVPQRLIRETHGVQVLINLHNKHAYRDIKRLVMVGYPNT